MHLVALCFVSGAHWKLIWDHSYLQLTGLCSLCILFILINTIK